jgi:hypothetical protein
MCVYYSINKRQKMQFHYITVMLYYIIYLLPVPHHHMTVNELEQDWFDFQRRTNILESLR